MQYVEVRHNLYICFNPFEIVEESRKVNGCGNKYYKIPIILLMFLTPILGGLFVIAFPMIIFASIIYSIFAIIFGNMKEDVLGFGVQEYDPIISYLANREIKDLPLEEEELEEELKELVSEVEIVRKSE